MARSVFCANGIARVSIVATADPLIKTSVCDRALELFYQRCGKANAALSKQSLTLTCPAFSAMGSPARFMTALIFSVLGIDSSLGHTVSSDCPVEKKPLARIFLKQRGKSVRRTTIDESAAFQ